MRKLVLALFAVATAAPVVAQGYHLNDGYVRRDGTYVAPHYQTNPDGNVYNNWSTRGNVNPFTGQQGTVNPNSGNMGNFFGGGRGSNGTLGNYFGGGSAN